LGSSREESLRCPSGLGCSADEEEYVVDDKTLRFLRLLRELVRGRNTRQVYTVVAARELGIDIQTQAGHREYEKHLADLELAEYLLRHPNPNLSAYGVYLITDKGIAVAEEFYAPDSEGALDRP
jgi:hypothetical protein